VNSDGEDRNVSWLLEGRRQPVGKSEDNGFAKAKRSTREGGSIKRGGQRHWKGRDIDRRPEEGSRLGWGDGAGKCRRVYSQIIEKRKKMERQEITKKVERVLLKKGKGKRDT